MPASTLLLVENDPTSGATITGVLTGVGYTIDTVADAAEALRLAPDHQLIIIDVVEGDRTAFDVCREIRATPAVASVPVLCIGQTDEVEERIRFLEAGADDVMAKPFDDRELEARVEALLLRFQRSKDLTPTITGEATPLLATRRTVAVFSPKGGVGTTTIATNIAMAIAQRRPDRVVLIDLDLQFGQAATHLNLEFRHSLADIARDEAALLEPELLRTYAVRHDAGLHLFAAPPTPEQSELITPHHVEQLLRTALGTYDSIVIDAGSILDERTLAIFEAAETVILPVYPEIAALKAVHGLLDYLNETGELGTKTTFVLNNAFAREILKLRDVESALGTKIGLELPYDPFLYLKAVNEGNPIVRGAPKSVPAERLVKLAAVAFGEDAPASDNGRSPRGAKPVSAKKAVPARKPGLLGALRRGR